ncbi:ribonuclease H-like protein [Fusarium austroafricanum]|uniref:ribonuclease H n=1 Tax=Fusarium austroafricanum TaxID=2364996 RepID=A0A8H4KHS7_9HYPO|nr:ribonuclease H-like protein [Fusarium austroafricanum]
MVAQVEYMGWCEVISNAESDNVYKENDLLFEPENSFPHHNIPERHLITYNPRKRISQLRTTLPRTGKAVRDTSSVVIHINGACRRNGSRSARGSWGVYFGPDSSLNWSGLLPSDAPQTSNFAEIWALQKAVDAIRDDILPDKSLSQVFIASDSSYLVKAFTEYMEHWLDNGGYNARGERVAHWPLIKDIHYDLDYMTWGRDALDIKFWHVPREMNQGADKLANRAFDRRRRDS